MSSIRKRPREQADEPLHSKKDRRLGQHQRYNVNTSPVSHTSSLSASLSPSETTSSKPSPQSPVDVQDLLRVLTNLAQGQAMNCTFSILNRIRQISDSMFAICKNPGASSTKSQAHPLVKSGLVAFVMLRQSHRNLQSEVEICKERTIEHNTSALANINLQIDELLYEKMHYLREIKSCRSYQPIEKGNGFLEDLIESSAEHERSTPMDHKEMLEEDERIHQETIKRFELELEQREALLMELDKILPPRKSLWLQKIKTRNNECDKLFKRLEQLRGQVIQLQTDCNISFARQVQAHQLARHLPLPLYNIYVQLTSWVELQPEKMLSVSILGDKANAQQINRSWECKNLKALRELSAVDLHKSHSLSLLLKFMWPTSGNPVSVRIEYLVHLRIVMAIGEMIDDPYFLALLYPEDSGEFSPNFFNSYIRDEKKPFQILKSKGRAFRWLQFLAGLHFVRPLPVATPISFFAPDSEKNTDQPRDVMTLDAQGVSEYSLTQVMLRLFRRLKVRETLNSHVSLLKSGKIPVECNVKPAVSNTSWLHRWEDQSYLQAKELFRIIESKQRDGSDESNGIVPAGTTVCVVSPPEFVMPGPTQIESSSRFFKFMFAFSDIKDKVCGLVQVFADYPSRIPVFLLYLETTGESSECFTCELLNIQSAINHLELDNTVPEENQVLAHQIAKLRLCLDIMHDINKQKGKSTFANVAERYTKQFWKSLS